MTIEEKIEILESLFYKSVEKNKLYGKTYKGMEFFYRIYQETHIKFQEYICRKE